jgi:hypothetical protein
VLRREAAIRMVKVDRSFTTVAINMIRNNDSRVNVTLNGRNV